MATDREARAKSELRVVVSVAVVIESGFGVELAARVLEGVGEQARRRCPLTVRRCGCPDRAQAVRFEGVIRLCPEIATLTNAGMRGRVQHDRHFGTPLSRSQIPIRVMANRQFEGLVCSSMRKQNDFDVNRAA